LSKHIVILALVLAFGMSLSAATILNPSFEQPPVANFQYTPVDPTGGWTFSGFSGVASQTFFQGPAPDGNQVAFLQQYVTEGSTLSSISQTISGVGPGYHINFFAAERSTGYLPNPVNVFYAGTLLGTFTPGSPTFVAYSFTLPSGSPTSGVLMFQSVAPTNGDLDTAIDLVSAGTIPEPGTAMLIVPALGILGLVLRRRAVR
jgi:hypothetical protein